MDPSTIVHCWGCGHTWLALTYRQKACPGHIRFCHARHLCRHCGVTLVRDYACPSNRVNVGLEPMRTRSIFTGATPTGLDHKLCPVFSISSLSDYSMRTRRNRRKRGVRPSERIKQAEIATTSVWLTRMFGRKVYFLPRIYRPTEIVKTYQTLEKYF